MSLMPDQGPYAVRTYVFMILLLPLIHPPQVPLSVGPSIVGGPVYFTHGPFAGKTVRTSAAEIQKADIGRK